MLSRVRIHFAAMIILATTLTGAQAQARLISESSEMQMGRDAARQIESRYRVSTDRALTSRVQSIGRRLASVSSRPRLPWRFKVLETKEVNALAVPGYVYVNRGLIDFVGSDTDALAGVIAHEIAHTAAYHAVKTIEKQYLAGIALEFLTKKPDARKIGSAAANLALLGYSRKDEYEADRLGVNFMRAAGYNPNGMLRFFKKLRQKEGRDPSGLTVYFRTHPPTKDRISRAEAQIRGR